MYAHCLFCTSALGHNESIEHFPVGRRLAYDPVKGRLWVICRTCEQWNLTPLEVRWEAIEQAESLYRQSRLRIATENIGLAQLSEGLELVRIGTPPKLELAGWRYGDQFGRRRRKYFARTGIGMVIAGLPMLGWMGAAVSLAGSGLVLTHSVASMIRSRRDATVPTVFIPDEAGKLLPLSLRDTWTAKLVPNRATGEWYLSVQHRRLDSAHAQTRLSRWGGLDQAPDPVKLQGDVALRALATVLPHANMMGATRGKIHEAVRVIETASNVHQLVYKAAETQTRWSTSGSTPITGLPVQLRLAMENGAA